MRAQHPPRALTSLSPASVARFSGSVCRFWMRLSKTSIGCMTRRCPMPGTSMSTARRTRSFVVRLTILSERKSTLFHSAAFQTVSHFARLQERRVVKAGDPRLPAEDVFSQALCKSGVADKVGIGRDSRNEIGRTLDLQVIGPESQRLTADEKAAGRANAEDHLHLLGCQWFLNIAPILHRTRAADGSSARRAPAQAGSCAAHPTARHAQADPPRQGRR